MRIGRTPTDVALLDAAALVEVSNGLYQRVRLALGGVNMHPVLMRAAEKRIEGQPVVNAAELMQFVSPSLQTDMAAFNPPSDFRASNGYRRTSGLNLAFRALEEAINISRQPAVSSSRGDI